MKYTLFGFSQEAAVGLGLDLTDLAILRYIADFSHAGMKSIVRNDKNLYWVLYSALIEELPLCGINSKDALARRMGRMVKAGVLIHETVREGGTYSYYGFGDNYARLISSTGTAQESDTLRPEGRTPSDPKAGTKTLLLKDPSTKDPSTKYNAPASREELEKELQSKSMTYYSKPLTPECLRIMVERMYTYYDPDNTGVWRYKGKPVKNWKACCGTYLDPHGYSAGKLQFVEPEKTAKERWGQESVSAEEWAKNAPNVNFDNGFIDLEEV